MLRLLYFVVGLLDTNTYLVYDEETRDAVVIDPGGEVNELINWIERLNLNLRAILATHGHFDHVWGVDDLKSHYNAPFYMHHLDVEIARTSMSWVKLWGVKPKEAPTPDHTIANDQVLRIGSIDIVAIHTPGHTPGSTCFYIPRLGALFSGDTLFAGTVGRTDLPGGSSEDLMKSLAKIFRRLPLDTFVYPGHGPSTTLRRELRANIYVEDALRIYGELKS